MLLQKNVKEQPSAPPPPHPRHTTRLLGRAGSGVYPGYRKLELPSALQRAESEDQGGERGSKQQPQVPREHHHSLPERELLLRKTETNIPGDKNNNIDTGFRRT